jgi:hypothetical protein
VTLDASELAKLAQIVDGVYQGKQVPRRSGRFGQYLRQCSRGRFEVQQLLAREGVTTAKGGWASGTEIGPVTLCPLAPLEGSVPNDLWGPVEHLPALCESLGGVVDLTLWTSAAAANRAHVLLAAGPTSLSLSGAYRWFAPSRVTPGEARVNPAEFATHWRDCRFLKATADDVSRPAHALEYVLDYRIGKPGLKVFRVLSVRVHEGEVSILPGLDAPARLTRFAHPADGRLASLRDGDVALVFAYVEPWTSDWVVIDVEVTDAAGCFNHLVTWADFQAELQEKPELALADLNGLRAALIGAGLDPPPPHELVVALSRRALNRPARALARWLRYRV